MINIDNIKPKFSQALKIAGLCFIFLIVVLFFLTIISSSFKTLFYKGQTITGQGMSSGMSMDNSVNSRSSSKMSEQFAPDAAGGASGNSEEYEMTEYSSYIETNDAKTACANLASLKTRADVVFENLNDFDKGCNYRFKVDQVSTKEIISIIWLMKPQYLNENVYTIKGQIDDYSNDLDILNKKLIAIDETMANAEKAYDDVAKLATNVKDIDSLTKIIDSKITMIERLAQERIDIKLQMDRIYEAKATQLDHLKYNYFNVNIQENKYIDIKAMHNSWKQSIREFITDLNGSIQDFTLGLVMVTIKILQYAIYLAIIFVIIKFAWKYGKKYWLKQ